MRPFVVPMKMTPGAVDAPGFLVPSFLAEYDALASGSGDPAQTAEKQVGLLLEWLLQRPAELFAELRENRPILMTPGPVLVSRYTDVLEVAGTTDVYSVAPYGEAMMLVNGGPNFILGMDDSPEFDHDLAALKLAARRTDLDRIRSTVAALAHQQLDAARAVGKIDLTDQYGRLVPALLAGEYFGVPGSTPQELMTWCRAMFREIFVNFLDDPVIREAGIAAGVALRAHVEHQIAQAHTGKPCADTVLQRLVDMQCSNGAHLTDQGIRDNLIGCVVGILDNTVAAVCNVMDHLLEHESVLASTRAAAGADDNDLLLKYVYESLRFYPPAPILVRLTIAEHVLAKGTPRETTIPVNKLVFAANGSAMMDDTELPAPLEFHVDRPGHDYLLFGWGMHRCFGEYISQVQIVELVKALLLEQGLRRAPGPEGTLSYDGAFPNPFSVAFGPAASQS
jgi:cytochrome P450